MPLRISSKEDKFLCQDRYLEMSRELIMNLIHSKMKGFDQWQSGFSKVIESSLSPFA